MVGLLSIPDATVVVAFLGLCGIGFTAWNGFRTNKQVKQTNGWAAHLAKTAEYTLAELHDLQHNVKEIRGWAENHDEKHDIEARDRNERP